jgi:glycosyltransferase involved in cell wall biosynthesis
MQIMKLRIAVYAIALNEIKHVDRWLEATKHADVRVVADTGSTDGTPEKLKEAGVQVHHITVKPWRFDVARNAALALVPNDIDVCLILDLDEVPEKDFFKKVRNQWVPGAHRGWIWLDTGQPWKADRLHVRHNYHWVCPCHEVAMFYGDEEQKYCEIDAHIKHEPDSGKSRKHYLQILELAVKERPHDARMWNYLVREYYYNQMWEPLLTAADKMLELPGWVVEQAAVCRWAGEACHWLNKVEEATAYFDRGVQILPTEGEPWYGVCVDAYRRHQWGRLLDAAIKIMELPRSTHHVYESAVWDWKAYDFAAVAAYNLGHVAEALTFAKKALNAPGAEGERVVNNIKFMEGVLNGSSS